MKLSFANSSDGGRPHTRSHHAKALMFVVVAALLALLAYSPGLSGGFIFDDIPALSGNSQLNFDASVFDQWRTAAFSSNAGPTARPVTMLTFALNSQLAGEVSPWAIKFTNVLIHVLIGVLVYLFVHDLMSQYRMQSGLAAKPAIIAAMTAVIWLLHPLHVSTVLYSVQRMAQMATLFVLVGLIVFMRYRSRWALSGATIVEVASALLWLLFVGVLGFYSKENAILLFWLILALELFVFSGEWAGERNNWLGYMAGILFILPVFFAGYLLVMESSTIIGGYANRDFTLLERLLTQSRLLWQYISWLAWPNILNMGFHHDDIQISKNLFQPVSTLLSLVTWVLVIFIGLLLRKSNPILIFCIIFYLIAHSIESSFLALEMVFEHRNYLPSIGVVMLLSFIICNLLARFKRSMIYAMALVGVLSLSLLLALRSYSWGNDERFALDNFARHPQSARSAQFYSHVLLRRSRQRHNLGLSREEYDQSLLDGRHYVEVQHQIDPADVGALVMLYTLDRKIFQELGLADSWLEKVSSVLEYKKVLSASDRSALTLLFSCIGDNTCPTDDHIVDSLFLTLERRFPDFPDIVAWKYLYLTGRNTSSIQLIVLLEEALEHHRNHLSLYPLLVHQYSLSKDMGGVLATLTRWLKADRYRQQLTAQQIIFSAENG